MKRLLTRTAAGCIALLLLLLLTSMAPAVAQQQPPITLLATGDTQGHVAPCRSCPTTQGLGGLARRATFVRDMRSEGPALLVDAGNALFGPESLASKGAVIAHAYDALAYDAVNLGYRDFRLGKAATLAALDEAGFAAVSANLHDADTGDRLFAPFVVREQGEQRIAIVGVTERPAGLAFLPHLQEQLAGVDVRPPAEALAAVLPEAREAADAVVLLYYGSATSVRALLDELGEADAGALRAVVAAGDAPVAAVPAAVPPIGWTPKHGTHVTQWTLPADDAPTIDRIEVDGDIEPDADLAAALEPMTRVAPANADEAEAGAAPAPAAVSDRLPAAAALEVDRPYRLNAEAENRAMRLRVASAALHEQYAGEPAPAGHRWLVMDAAIENQMPIDLLFDLEYQEAVLIASLPRQLYLLIDGRRVHRLSPLGDDHIPPSFTLTTVGAAAEGKLVYAVPDEVESLSLRYYHDQYALLVLPLLGEELVDADEPITEPQANDFMELAVYGAERHDQWEGEAAPAGMQWLAVDLRGRGRLTIEADARAVEGEDAPVDERIDLPKVMEYMEAASLLQVVVAGEHGYVRELEMGTLLTDPVLLPDAWAGGVAVFAVPTDAESIELVCYFPRFQAPGASAAGTPAPMRFTLEGESVEPEPEPALAVVHDQPTPFAIYSANVTGQFGKHTAEAGRKLVVLDAAMRNDSAVGGLMAISSRLTLRSDAGGGRQVAAVVRGPWPLVEPMWLPAGGERRRFTLVYSVPAAATSATLSYGGVSVNTSVNLDLPEEGLALAAREQPEAEPVEPGEAAPGFEPVAEADLGTADVDASADADAVPDADAEADAAAGEAADEPGDTAPRVPAAVADADDAAGLAVEVIDADAADAWLSEQNRTAVNLALHSFGARVTPSKEMRASYSAEWHNGRLDMRRAMPPGVYELRLAGGRPAPVHQVAIAFETLYEDSRFRIEARNGAGGYTHLATLDGIEQRDWHIRVLTFDPVVTDRIRITRYADSDRDRDRARTLRVPEIMVFEGPLASKAESVLSQGGMAISQLELGGSIFHTELGGTIGNVLTPPAEGRFNTSVRVDGDAVHWFEPITLAFQANREALVASLELQPAVHEAYRDHLPGRVRISASRHEPFEGYEVIGEYEVTDGARPWRVTFDQPVRARFLRVELGAEGDPEESGSTVLAVGGLVVREGTEPGYESVLIRGDGMDWRNRELPTLAELLGDAANAVQPVAGGASAASAASVALEQWVGGVFDEPDQRQAYRFTLDHDDGQIPELTLHMTPFLRGRVRILDAEGAVLETLDAGRRAKTTLRHVLTYEPGEYVLELSAAPVYLFMGFDVSGSMGSALRITPDILPGLTENLPAGVHVALGSSHANDGKRFTLYSEYTRDAEALRVAMNEKEINGKTMFSGGGGSDWYNYMGDMMVWADANMPEHAVGATVLVADGVGSGDYSILWDRLQSTRQRLYTVAWGSASLRLEHLDKRTGWTASRGMFNAAWYRNGRYFEPQMNEQLIETYEAILDDVQTPAEYALRVHVRDRLPGRLATTKPAGENRPTLFVLDASGSMMETIAGDRTRLDVAMDVMQQVIADLPEGSHVGLRVYGHRFRAFGSEREKAATDSQLLIPIQPLNRRTFTTTLRRINARGATPLAHTMEQVADDLRGADRPRVIVLTDGVESFRRDPVTAMQNLVEQHLEMELAVVGFQIGEQVDRETLRGMADAGRGDYHNAMDGDTLVQSVNEAMNPTIRYTLHAQDGSQAAVGTFGDRHALPEGAYELRARVDGGEARLPLQISAERTVRLTLGDLPKAQPVADEAETELEPEPATPTSSPVRFCTQCDEPLASDARFCTQCGEPVPE